MATAAIEAGSTERAQRYLKLGEVSPSALLVAPELTAMEKRWILQQRILDLDAELRAANENMTSEQPNFASERLRDAHRALLLLNGPENVPPATE